MTYRGDDTYVHNLVKEPEAMGHLGDTGTDG